MLTDIRYCTEATCEYCGGPFLTHKWASERLGLPVHQVVYRLSQGPIPKGMVVRHSCDNPPCCNAAHLLLGTYAENMADCTSRRRQAYGERNSQAILRESDVLEIRQMIADGITGRAVAKRFGVHFGTISDIVTRKTWKHLSSEEPVI